MIYFHSVVHIVWWCCYFSFKTLFYWLFESLDHIDLPKPICIYSLFLPIQLCFLLSKFWNLFIFILTKSNLCYPYTLELCEVYSIDACDQLSRSYTNLKKTTDSSSFSSCQCSITPWPRVGLHTLLFFQCWLFFSGLHLHRFYKCCHKCHEFICTSYLLEFQDFVPL